jgi:hypothetical protein
MKTMDRYRTSHRLDIELDLQSLFRLHVHAKLYLLAETPQPAPPPRIWAQIRGRYRSATNYRHF